MSDLIAAKPKAETPKLKHPEIHDTCSTCAHGQLVPQDLNALICFGAPPTPVLVGVQQTPMGQQPAFMNARPTVQRSDRACGAYKRKIVLAS